jgi:hypothetical protein
MNDVEPVTEVRNKLLRLRASVLGREPDTMLLSHAIAHLHRLLPTEDREGKYNIPSENSILMYLHCRQCLEEVQELAKIQGTASPHLYSRYAVGWTTIGLQIICSRHNANIAHIDFQGAVHPANLHA